MYASKPAIFFTFAASMTPRDFVFGSAISFSVICRHDRLRPSYKNIFLDHKPEIWLESPKKAESMRRVFARLVH